MRDTVFYFKEKDGRVRIQLPVIVKKENLLQLQNRIDSLLTTNKIRKVIVSLSDIKYLSSMLIELLMQIRRAVLKVKGKLFLVDVTPKCLETMEVLKLDQILTVSKNEDEIL